MPMIDTAMKIALLGPPGSGKGSQCVRIKERYPDLCYINAHMMLRDEINRQTPLGLSAQAKMLQGEVIDNGTYTQLMLERAKSSACKAGYILDGLPIDVRQAEEFVKNGECLDAVIFLHVDDETVLRRTSGRWVHQRSGRIYHDVFARPKAPGVDDDTGEKLIQRHDDSPVVAQARLDVFKANAAALREYFALTAAEYQKRQAANRATQPQPIVKQKQLADANEATEPTNASPAVPDAASSAGLVASTDSPVSASQTLLSDKYKPTVYPNRAPTVSDVDANGGLETVRIRVFAAIDAAIQAKKESLARATWFKLW